MRERNSSILLSKNDNNAQINKTRDLREIIVVVFII